MSYALSPRTAVGFFVMLAAEANMFFTPEELRVVSDAVQCVRPDLYHTDVKTALNRNLGRAVRTLSRVRIMYRKRRKDGTAMASVYVTFADGSFAEKRQAIIARCAHMDATLQDKHWESPAVIGPLDRWISGMYE